MVRIALLALLLAFALPAQAGLLGKTPEEHAAQAESQGLPAVTIWVEASWGFRKSGAANDLSAMHRAFYAHGYHVVAVQPYIENGDLQGFFVTYEKSR